MRISLRTWEVRLGIVLVASSVAIYGVKYLLLGDVENTYQYIFNALGFLPINVLLVTLILNQLLSVRAKRDRLDKLNMVIGTFFSEVGTELLTILSDRDPNLPEIRHDLVVTNAWTPERFSAVRDRLRHHTCRVTVGAADLQELCRYLTERRGFLLRLLENPVLMEHESFTDLLRAVFHLTEELERRGDFAGLPASDVEHLAGDVERVYGRLIGEWLAYMEYLQRNYPYLFSLAMRSNPFDETASPVVR
ncbi:MAG: hypothetical protein M0P21_03290 [Methanoculleus sp.]|jgi:hypothetical protein|uniref:hypothetical protein n=1 Tax=Methanoculleus nereidis TaxID=2735141 RepID=UPI000CA69DF5|nr:hypothetical protein [Methanoculleus sp. YWC-01]MCK9297974.1 hypothetical protein [Methanoculleus sp.]PKL56625.1 MAG: hypothetical protein CVV35_04015 [Methanomicrobiales archaeon HGW-Methanomicrobiales-6]